ncbi:MAG: glycosyl transferase [Ktedonobacteraceae bacterium]|nr:glycosyl transferase [Ktedonobacteraceae bacterium]
MATYVFLNIPAHGHVNPTLAVAHELVQRGEKVIYYLTEEFRAAVEATGATFRSYQSQAGQMQPPTNFNFAQGTRPPNAMPFMVVDEGARVLPQVLESIRADRPDYILYDMMCLWAKIAARSLHVPAILFRPSYAANEQNNIMGNMANGGNMGGMNPVANSNPALGTVMAADSAVSSDAGSPPVAPGFLSMFNQVNDKLAELCRAYNVEPFSAQEMFLGVEPLTIVFIPKEFQPNGETFDDRFVFVGPSIQPRPNTSNFPLDRLTEKTTLYISLGTVFNNQAAFYNMCFAAFKDEPWQIVLSTGTKVDQAALDPIPDNFLVASQVPQLEVLQHTSLFLTHNGMNSTMESLYYGVPMVGIPQMPEQMMTARRVQELKLGTAFDKNALTVELLRTTVEQAMANESYRANAKTMQQHVRNAGGYRRAADAIMKFEQSHRQAART